MRNARLLVDGPNMDGCLSEVLGHKPGPAHRPDWGRMLDALEQLTSLDVVAEFVIRGGTGEVSSARGGFYRFLMQAGYHVSTPSRSTDPTESDPVDDHIRRQIRMIVRGVSDEDAVILAAHDHGYAASLRSAAENGRQVFLVGFAELISAPLARLVEEGHATFFDLERDLYVVPALPNRPKI
jgi:hypothetical protein